MWGILYSFILYIYIFYRVLLVLMLGCVIPFKFGSTILFSFLFLFLFLIIIRLAPFAYDSYFLISAHPLQFLFPYVSPIPLWFLFPYTYHISSKKIWKFRGAPAPPRPPPPPPLCPWSQLSIVLVHSCRQCERASTNIKIYYIF